MSFDVGKLTPGPLEADGSGEDRWEGQWDIGHPCKDRTGREDFLIRGTDMREHDAKFFADARNAFDIQMQMGWGVVLDEDEGWYVIDSTDLCRLVIPISKDNKENPDNWLWAPFGTNAIEAILKTWEWWEANKYREVKS